MIKYACPPPSVPPEIIGTSSPKGEEKRDCLPESKKPSFQCCHIIEKKAPCLLLGVTRP